MPCAIERDDTHVFKSVHLIHIEHHMNVTERFCSNFFSILYWFLCIKSISWSHFHRLDPSDSTGVSISGAAGFHAHLFLQNQVSFFPVGDGSFGEGRGFSRHFLAFRHASPGSCACD